MQRWEYKSIFVDIENTTPVLKNNGLDGWELVNIQFDTEQGSVFITFKRPLKD